jgi:hypothetical protein
MKQTLELSPEIAPTKTKTGLRWLWLRDLDRLLRGEATKPEDLMAGEIPVSSDRLQIAIVLLGMVYGLCMGTYALLRGESASMLQFVSGMVKVPALFLLTLLVTFPSLYVFNALVGSRLTAVALWRLLTSSVALNMAVLASLGPIVAFFSMSTSSYSFMLLLNVLMFTVAGTLGLKFLLRTLQRMTLTEAPLEVQSPPKITTPPGATGPLEGPEPQPQVKVVFGCWVMAFALVGAQMSWLLRPFIGNPTQPFTFFRGRESNFFEAVWNHLNHLFGG